MRRVVLVLVCAFALPVSTARAWTWPVNGPVLRPFAFDHDSPYEVGQHRGIDIGASTGTPVLAPADGVVSFAGTVPTGGKTISIQTPYGYTATLLHLGSIGVKRGAAIREGAVVGAAGAEPYVYFGVRMTSDPQGYVDPIGFLPAPSAAPTPTPAQAVQVPAEPSVPAVESTAALSPEPVAETLPQAGADPVAESSAADEAGEGLVVVAKVKPGAAASRGTSAEGRPTRAATSPAVRIERERRRAERRDTGCTSLDGSGRARGRPCLASRDGSIATGPAAVPCLRDRGSRDCGSRRCRDRPVAKKKAARRATYHG